jgi:hypothetical protein
MRPAMSKTCVSEQNLLERVELEIREARRSSQHVIARSEATKQSRSCGRTDDAEASGV